MNLIKALVTLILIAVFVSCKSPKEKLTEKIKANEEKLFNDSTKMLDPRFAAEELAAYQEFVNTFPTDTAAAGYLFKAADLAHGMRKSYDAVRLYKEFIAQFPAHPKAAAGEFLLAFVYDNDLKQKDSAKIFYKSFLQKYPEHQLAPSAKASLDQIEMGLSDEELVKMFEARLDSSKSK